MARRLKGSVLVVAPPGSGQSSAVFGPDDTDIPDWALEQMGDHVWEDGGDSSGTEEKPAAKKAAAKRSSSSK